MARPAVLKARLPGRSGPTLAVLRAEADAAHLGRQLIRTFESITDAFYTLDREWRFTYVNREAERLQQRTRFELLGRVVWEVFPEAVGSAFDVMFRRAVETGQTAVFDAYYPPLDLWASVRAFPSEDGLAVYFLDVSAQRAAEQALAASEHRYRTLFERAGDALLLVDDVGSYVDVNAAGAVLLGLPREDIIGRSLNDFVMVALDDAGVAAGWQAFLAAGEMGGEVRVRRANGEVRDVEFDAIANISPGIHLSVLRDITDRRRNERTVTQRRHVMDALRRLSPADDPADTADAICAEIVGNGEFSSAAILALPTDEAAAILANRFRAGQGVPEAPSMSADRVNALIARAASGPWVNDWMRPDQAATRAAMARLGVTAAVNVPIEFQGRAIAVLAAGSAEEASELTLRIPALVDFAALAASLLGPGLSRRSRHAAERARIQQIITTRAFRPVFQAVVDMVSGAVLGYEALSRFSDGTPPDRAFHMAAKVGLGLAMEGATLEAAISASAFLPPGGFLNLNVSPDMVMASQPLLGLLARTTRTVVVEITEHVDVPDYAALRCAISALGPGVRCAVDDAGAGFASMRHILELAPSVVKLDRALVAGIDGDLARQALVAGLVHFADTIKLTLVAEGVETEAERRTLLHLGVHAAQGYLFGRPVPAGEILPPAHAHSGPARMT